MTAMLYNKCMRGDTGLIPVPFELLKYTKRMLIEYYPYVISNLSM
jgi:hypothetical protein